MLANVFKIVTGEGRVHIDKKISFYVQPSPFFFPLQEELTNSESADHWKAN
jgi:hypothetical protein